MKIVYYSGRGAFSAYLSAALHTGHLLAGDAGEASILQQYAWVCRYGKHMGNLVFMGMDEAGREVYWAGYQRHSGMIRRAQEHLKAVFGLSERVVYVDAGDLEGWIPLFLAFYLKHRGPDPGVYSWFARWREKGIARCAKRVSEVKASLKGAKCP